MRKNVCVIVSIILLIAGSIAIWRITEENLSKARFLLKNAEVKVQKGRGSVWSDIDSMNYFLDRASKVNPFWIYGLESINTNQTKVNNLLIRGYLKAAQNGLEEMRKTTYDEQDSPYFVLDSIYHYLNMASELNLERDYDLSYIGGTPEEVKSARELFNRK